MYLPPQLPPSQAHLTEKLASTRHESVSYTSRVTLAERKASSQASSRRSGDWVGVAGWDGIHWVCVRALVSGTCCSIVVIVVIVACRASVISRSTVGVTSCSSFLLTSVVLLGCSGPVVVGGGAGIAVRESAGVGGCGDHGGKVGAGNVVSDKTGLGRDGGGGDGEEHALIGAVIEAEEEGLAGRVGLALGCTVVGGSCNMLVIRMRRWWNRTLTDSSWLGERSLGCGTTRSGSADLAGKDGAGR